MLIVAAAALAIAFAACGASETDRAGAVAARYMSALGDRDAELACRQLTTAAKHDIARYVRRALPELGTTSCAGVIRGALDLLDDAAVSALREVKVRSVSITGETATAQLEGRSDPVNLIRDDGTWKIARLQFL